MKKTLAFFLIVLMSLTLNVKANEDEQSNQDTEEEKTTETVEDIVNDISAPKEVNGSIYGSVYGKSESEDIIVDVPSGSGNFNVTDKKGDAGNKGMTASDDKETASFSWDKDSHSLVIRKAMLDQAKSEEKNLVMRIYNEADHSLQYRVKVYYQDIKEQEVHDLKINFGDECNHKEKIAALLTSAEARNILMCKQEEVDFKVYVGVAVPKSWDHGYSVYQYEYLDGEKELSLVRKDLQIDSENVVEVPLTTGKDYVFYRQALPTEANTLSTWVNGLTGNSPNVDQGNAVKSVIAYGTGAALAVGSLLSFIKIRKMKFFRREKKQQGWYAE